MLNMLVIFPKSMDADKVDELLSTLVSSLRARDGLLSMQVSEGGLMSPGGAPAYSKVLEVVWESLAHMMAWTETAADLENPKDAIIDKRGVVLFYEVKALPIA